MKTGNFLPAEHMPGGRIQPFSRDRYRCAMPQISFALMNDVIASNKKATAKAVAYRIKNKIKSCLILLLFLVLAENY